MRAQFKTNEGLTFSCIFCEFSGDLMSLKLLTVEERQVGQINRPFKLKMSYRGSWSGRVNYEIFV